MAEVKSENVRLQPLCVWLNAVRLLKVVIEEVCENKCSCRMVNCTIMDEDDMPTCSDCSAQGSGEGRQRLR